MAVLPDDDAVDAAAYNFRAEVERLYREREERHRRIFLLVILGIILGVAAYLIWK